MSARGAKETAAIIIGAGLMGRHHARAAAAAGASIVGVLDSDLEAARSLAGRWPAAKASTDLKEVLKSRGPTVAHICTPDASHMDIAEAVAKAGLHALIEKPLGVTAKDAKLIHELFASAGRLACPTHQYAFQRSVRVASAEMPRLGALRRIAFDICSAGAVAGHINPDALIAEILPHPLSIVQKLLPAVDVERLDWSCMRSTAGEWLASASAEGALITMSLSAGGRPTRFQTQLIAEDGSIEIDNFHDFAVVLSGRVSKARKILAPFARSSRGFAAATANLLARVGRREFAYPGLRTLVDDFYAAVRGQSAPPIAPQESIAVAEARDKIMELASRG